jgi:hypothetical protein
LQAFWNDQFQATADSYYGSTCAYSSYSDEAVPYTNCSTDAQCGNRGPNPHSPDAARAAC